jgi:hypothetical protein
MDDLDCLACCERTDLEPFKPTPRARNMAYEYRFDPSQGFQLMPLFLGRTQAHIKHAQVDDPAAAYSGVYSKDLA